MKYYKTINGGYFVSIGTGTGGTNITETEYNELLSITHNRPIPPTGFDYKLNADTLEWELVELPPIEPTDEEATESDYITALQDLGVEVE